jgi:hypothetical protein|eukprot:SAG25_NODE_690_length_5919_cov_13.007045_11_plen_83_part_00
MPHNQLLEVTLANLGADDVSYVQRVNNIMTLCTSHVNNSHPIFRVFGGVPGLESVISAAKGLSMKASKQKASIIDISRRVTH